MTEEISKAYHDIPEEDRKKAKVFFDRGKSVAEMGNFDYAIEMYLQGLAIDPEEISAQQALRDISLKRKASGGKSLGMIDSMRLKSKSKDPRQNMQSALRLLAFEPGNTDYMAAVIQSALAAGYYETVLWMGPILLRANAELKKPEFSKFIILKDAYKQLERWPEASQACKLAMEIRKDDLTLNTEWKNIAAHEAMVAGGYENATSFRDSLKNAESQQKLLDEARSVQSVDSQTRLLRDAQAEFEADPESKLLKYVDVLDHTDMTEHENRAIDLLDEAFAKNNQFRYRRRIGQIKIKQMSRMERSMRDMVRQDPNDQSLARDYEDFRREQLEFELAEYQLWSENYPSDLSLKFEVAARMFTLKRFDVAIPVFQQARLDPKLHFRALLFLGRSFFEAGFIDEAIATFQDALAEHQSNSDETYKELTYWLGRSQEQKEGGAAAALKQYSQLAQWDFNYRDVQARLKALRAKPGV